MWSFKKAAFWFVTFVSVNLLSCVGYAGTWKVEKKIPAFRAPVVDQYGVLSDRELKELSHWLNQVYKSTNIQIAILIENSLEGEVLEQYSLAVVESWKLGKAETDKGLLILLAMEERKLRIEVGQGLEGSLPDAFANQIIQKTMIPLIKRGNFAAAFSEGVAKILDRAEPDFNAGARPAKSGRINSSVVTSLAIAILFALVFLSRLRNITGGSRRRRGGFHSTGGLGNQIDADIWMGGRSSGGFGGFGSRGGFGGGGGGGFSGGGASGGW